MMKTVRRAGSVAGAWMLLLSATVGHETARADQDVARTTGTLRVDYYHTGRGGDVPVEVFSLDEVVREPLPWPGNPDRAIDTAPRGKYLFEARDPADDTLLYSRSFSSIYGEWETTAEAGQRSRTFHESLRLPDPGRPFDIVLLRRSPGEEFTPLWRTRIDPHDYQVRQASAAFADRVVAIAHRGPPADKVDLLLLGDGYTDDQQALFLERARELTDALFSVSPFRERRDDFNVWALMPTARTAGIARPSTGVHHDSPLGARYDAFGSERYILTYANRRWRDIAASAPYDFVEILTNSDTYGGGGIYGLYGTVAANNAWARYVFIHEFGHHFAGLADEYYTSPVAYTAPAAVVEPYEPNVTALLDPQRLKWAALVTPGAEVPTPWPKDEYDTRSRAYQARRVELRAERRPEAEMNALFERQQDFVEALIAAQANRDQVGAFEGANYASQGMYRSQMNCLMFTRTEVFCAVCAAAIGEIVDLYSRQGPPGTAAP